MIWRETGKLNALGYTLIASIVLFGFPMWDFLSHWHNFKGTYLLDQNGLKTTQGRIIQSSGYTSKWKKTTYFYYQIKYEYAVNGNRFQSEQVTFDDNYRVGTDFAESYRAKYPINKTVTVYYDRNDPSFAVLEPDVKDHFLPSWWFLYLSLIGFLVAGVMIVRQKTVATRKPHRISI